MWVPVFLFGAAATACLARAATLEPLLPGRLAFEAGYSMALAADAATIRAAGPSHSTASTACRAR